MSLQDYGTVKANASLKEVTEELANLMDTLNWKMNGQLDANNIRANSIETKNLKAGSVTADKISVNELSAITANLGHITAGLIESIEIYGSYIATSASYPRAEMSTTNNLFSALTSATKYISIVADDAGQPSIQLKNGSIEGSISPLTVGGMMLINTTVGGGKISISSGGDLELFSQGLVRVSDWDEFYSNGDGQTLQTALNNLSSSISSLSSSISSINSEISNIYDVLFNHDDRISALESAGP